jgi:ribosome-binding protein aMBF1 (putative translation factor)
MSDKKLLNKQRSILKQGRAELGISVAQASKGSKIQVTRLQRLEGGQYELMVSECIALEKFYGIEIFKPLFENTLPKKKAKVADSVDEVKVEVAEDSIAH